MMSKNFFVAIAAFFLLALTHGSPLKSSLNLDQLVRQTDSCPQPTTICLGNEALDYINRIRNSRGLRSFKVAPRLQRLAINYSERLAQPGAPTQAPPLPAGQGIRRTAYGLGTDPRFVPRFAPTIAVNNLYRDAGTRAVLLFDADAAGVGVTVRGDSYWIAIYVGTETVQNALPSPPPNLSTGGAPLAIP